MRQYPNNISSLKYDRRDRQLTLLTWRDKKSRRVVIDF